MPFKVQVGPSQISIHQGQTVLITEENGQIDWPSEKGLYFFDTRVISSWAIYANGERWDLLNGGALTYLSARIFLANRPFRTEGGLIPARTLGLSISRGSALSSVTAKISPSTAKLSPRSPGNQNCRSPNSAALCRPCNAASARRGGPRKRWSRPISAS